MPGAYSEMMRQDRQRLGLTIGYAAYRLGIKPTEYRDLEADGGQITSYDLWLALCELFHWPQTFAATKR